MKTVTLVFIVLILLLIIVLPVAFHVLREDFINVQQYYESDELQSMSKIELMEFIDEYNKYYIDSTIENHYKYLACKKILKEKYNIRKWKY